jgi:hypothetical protein
MTGRCHTTSREVSCVHEAHGAAGPLFVNGIPELFIPRLLKDDETYGYQIVRAILALDE